MNLRIPVLLVALTLACTSCLIPLPLVGGGVAGAGADDIWTLHGVRKYTAFQSPLVHIAHDDGASKCCAGTTLSFDQWLDLATARSVIGQDSTGRLGELTVSFHHQRLVASRDNVPIIDERLPSAFYRYPLDARRGRLDGQDVLAFTTRSIASTHYDFVGLYRVSGARLWIATLPTGELARLHIDVRP